MSDHLKSGSGTLADELRDCARSLGGNKWIEAIAKALDEHIAGQARI